MAIIKDGKLMNTPENQASVDKWLASLPKITCTNRETGETFKLPIAKTMSDLQWHQMCLKSRIEHPELYEKTEDIPKVIEYLKGLTAECEMKMSQS